MIEFEVFSDDPEVVELVEKYWSTDNNGKYLHNVADLLPFREITTTPKLLTFISGESRAWNPDNFCPICGDNISVRSRTDPAIKKLRRLSPCNHCQELQARDRARNLAVEQEALAEAMRKASDSARMLEIEYGQLPDDIALIVLALERAICPKLVEGVFETADLRSLINGPVSPLIERLINANVISDDPAFSQSGAYWLEDGELWFNMAKARYFLVPDRTYGASEDALTYLDNRPWDKNDELRSLWLDYATAECITYFLNQCGRYSLNPESKDVDNITSQIRVALDQYSIQELWCATWIVVKDAASLCKREFYNVTKATATMPGKLQRLLETVRKKQRLPLKAWTRPQQQPAGTLGELFYERYGLNESTPGAEAMRIFASPAPPAYDPFLESEIVQKGLIDVLVERIHHYKLGAQSLSIFAAGIREGLSIEDAIARLLCGLPSLQQGINNGGNLSDC
ncbi:hypothetical protein SAMN05660284_01598 [Formivibrio citricus]|uniref:Uncharacterized protein n=1 Tax=Formivibrio citricus TaxID=83765 RepID=A0A1I4ZDN0_9NEIS|nr:hypothetical protein [Formivibrio citricus]SFN48384.1 hypothetical protein SAMN05660284_01598 [Formivibrio citricus]